MSIVVNRIKSIRRYIYKYTSTNKILVAICLSDAVKWIKFTSMSLKVFNKIIVFLSQSCLGLSRACKFVDRTVCVRFSQRDNQDVDVNKGATSGDFAHAVVLDNELIRDWFGPDKRRKKLHGESDDLLNILSIASRVGLRGHLLKLVFYLRSSDVRSRFFSVVMECVGDRCHYNWY